MAKKRYYNSESSANTGHSMIKEDRSATANLPQSSMMKKWPKHDYASGTDLNDDISGINQQISDDVRGARKHKSKSKY